MANEMHNKAINSALSALDPPMRRALPGESGWMVAVKANCGCCICVGEYFRVWATDAPASNVADRSMYPTTKEG